MAHTLLAMEGQAKNHAEHLDYLECAEEESIKLSYFLQASAGKDRPTNHPEHNVFGRMV